MKRMNLTLILTVTLTAGATAAPVTLQQIQQPAAEQSPNPPFVRLSDGRIVPGNGPGVICSEEPATPEPGRERRARALLLALGVTAAGGFCAALCGESGPRNPGQPPAPFQPPTSVPEPSGLFLLGVSLFAAANLPRRADWRDLLARACCRLRLWRAVCALQGHAWVGSRRQARCLHCGAIKFYEFRERRSSQPRGMRAARPTGGRSGSTS
jgi:hypothetical protein